MHVHIYIYIYIYIYKYIYVYMKNIKTQVITTFLASVLTLNNFIFKRKYHLQIKSTTMGAIFIGFLTCKHLHGSLRKKTHIPIYQDIFTYIPQVYSRHIFVWASTKTD